MSMTLEQVQTGSWGGEWLVRPLRAAILRKMKNISYGYLEILEGSLVTVCGEKRPGEPHARIRVLKDSVWERVAFGGTVGASEAYMDGDWSTDHLVDVVRVFSANRHMMESVEGGLALVRWPLLKIWHLARKDTIEQARKNIAAHYDLGNDFFALWLDSSMAYSSGYFMTPTSTLLGASIRKVEKLCERLELKPADHLLEIGSGWGALAIFAASNYGCRVTTATISQNQYNHVRNEVKRLKLDHLIQVVFCDYRKLTGQYDKIVSVEMIEAVGHHYLDTYFAQINSLLKPNGRAAIQAITIRDQIYDDAIKGVDFIQRYIFPGSNIPSVSRMMDSVRDYTDMVMHEMEDLTEHYARTLSHWRKNFWKEELELRKLGLNDYALRMWDYYFAYCEGGFTERVIGVCQFVLTKPKNHIR